MTVAMLEAEIKELGAIPQPIPDIALMLRATFEVAYQLAVLNENGVRLQDIGVRGHSICVSIEQDVTR